MIYFLLKAIESKFHRLNNWKKITAEKKYEKCKMFLPSLN